MRRDMWTALYSWWSTCGGERPRRAAVLLVENWTDQARPLLASIELHWKAFFRGDFEDGHLGDVGRWTPRSQPTFDTLVQSQPPKGRIVGSRPTEKISINSYRLGEVLIIRPNIDYQWIITQYCTTGRHIGLGATGQRRKCQRIHCTSLPYTFCPGNCTMHIF